MQICAVKKFFFLSFVSSIRNGVCACLLLKNPGNCSHKSFTIHANYDSSLNGFFQNMVTLAFLLSQLFPL